MEQLINYLGFGKNFSMAICTKSCGYIPKDIEVVYVQYDEEDDNLIIETTDWTIEITMIKEVYEEGLGIVLACTDGTEYYFEAKEN